MNPKVTVRKTVAVLQALALGLLTALAGNLTLLPAKYQLPAILLVGALQSAMPSPLRKADTPAQPEEKQ
jgi:hypothetical protein